MINYVVGFISGICSFKIYKIIQKHIINKRFEENCKHYTVIARTPEELNRELKKLVKDMKENEENE